MISPFISLPPNLHALTYKKQKNFVSCFTQETKYIRGSTLFKEYSYITRILPSVHVTCVIPDPAMTLFIFFTGPTPGRTSQKL